MILLVLLLAAAAMPAAEYSTYVGDQNTWQVTRLLTDSSGNTYVAGGRTFNLAYDPLQPDLATEAIVAKLDPDGKTVLFAGIGGKGSEMARAVALDRAGNIYLAGSTSSPNFPVRKALYTTAGRGFLVKYTPDGADVVWATYFPEAIESMAVDSEGAVYVVGTTYSDAFPTTAGLPKGPAWAGVPMTSAAFLTKIAPAGDRIVYSTRISGGNKPCGAGSSCFTSGRGAFAVGVAVDASGNAYLAGNSDVTDLPTTPGVVAPAGSGGFVAKINAAGTALAYLTYIGSGSITYAPYFYPANRVRALAVDAAGNAYVAGTTWDPKLPFAGKFHGWSEIVSPSTPPPTDAYAAKLNPAGTAFVWGSYLGGDRVDEPTAGALDAAGNFWIAGKTNSTEFPNVDGWSTGEDFIVKFDGTGATPYSARYPNGSVNQSIAVDAAGLVHVASANGTVSAAAASARPAARPWMVGPAGGQIAAGEVIEIYGPHIGGPGATITFNDIPAPILYSGDQQINVVVPFELAGQETARIRVGSGPVFTAVVMPSAPQIAGVAINQDGSVNSPANPAKVGSVMTIWVSGAYVQNPPPPNGSIAGGADPYFVGLLYADGRQVPMLYAGAAPEMVAGVSQINFVAPDASSVVLVTGHYVSSPLYIYVAK